MKHFLWSLSTPASLIFLFDGNASSAHLKHTNHNTIKQYHKLSQHADRISKYTLTDWQ
jgi:hypothetical protein